MNIFNITYFNQLNLFPPLLLTNHNTNMQRYPSEIKDKNNAL